VPADLPLALPPLIPPAPPPPAAAAAAVLPPQNLASSLGGTGRARALRSLSTYSLHDSSNRDSKESNSKGRGGGRICGGHGGGGGIGPKCIVCRMLCRARWHQQTHACVTTTTPPPSPLVLASASAVSRLKASLPASLSDPGAWPRAPAAWSDPHPAEVKCCAADTPPSSPLHPPSPFNTQHTCTCEPLLTGAWPRALAA
jgi:hypothetical protein